MTSTRIPQARGSRARFLTIESWHLDICNQHQPAAAVLAFLVSYHNQRQAEKSRAADINAELKKKNRLPSWNQTDWQFHSDKNMMRGIMLFKIDSIRGGIKYLEKQQLIFTEPPDEFKELFSTGRTKWFLVNHDKITNWLYEFFDHADIDVAPPPPALPSDKDVPPAVQLSTNAKKMTGYAAAARRVYQFWQSRTGNEQFEADRAQLQYIIKFLQNSYKEYNLAHAIIGNTSAPFYVERSLHNISMIFKSADKVAEFIRLADKDGINAIKAREMYEAVVGVPEPAENASPVKQAGKAVAPADVAGHYKRAAKKIIELVRGERLPAGEVVRIFKWQEFDFVVRVLTDVDQLFAEMIGVLSADEIVSDQTKAKMKTYAKNLLEGLSK